ncbi:MAG: divergent PAP2 family protein [Spirochaetales bacterium]|jgi:acid phosphatase family membrane protein YuiD|nr:divergent PAP2 family protein [Spirochaetales bacterium]
MANSPAHAPAWDILFSNRVFMSALFSWFLAQFIKILIRVFRGNSGGGGKTLVHFLWGTGGMPSSHSAAMVSVTTAVGLIEGLDSRLFGCLVVLSIIIIRDALGVRHAAGVQAKGLNSLGHQLKKQQLAEYKPVKEINGHTLPEVTVGSILGFSIALAICKL